MIYRLTFEIDKLPKMANGGHFDWRTDHGRKMQWRKLVGQILLGKMPTSPLKKARATFTRCSSVQPDFDGLVHGFKPVRDALVHFGVLVDDSMTVLDAAYVWEKAKPKKGKIRVEIFGGEE